MIVVPDENELYLNVDKKPVLVQSSLGWLMVGALIEGFMLLGLSMISEGDAQTRPNAHSNFLVNA